MDHHTQVITFLSSASTLSPIERSNELENALQFLSTNSEVKQTSSIICTHGNNFLPALIQNSQDEKEIIACLKIVQYLCRYDGKSTGSTLKENLTLLGDSGVCEAIVALLSKQQSQAILEHICRTLRYLVYNHEVNKSRLGKLDGVSRLLDVLRPLTISQPSDPTTSILIQEACMALRNLIADQTDYKEQFGHLGGCEMMLLLIQHYLELFQSQPTVETAATGVIEEASGVLSHALCGVVLNQQHVSEAGGCALLCNVVHSYWPTDTTTTDTDHSDHDHDTHLTRLTHRSTLLEEVINCLGSLARYNVPTNQDYLGEEGGLCECLLLLLTLLHTPITATSSVPPHLVHILLIESIGSTLVHLVQDHRGNLKRIIAANACTVCVQILQIHAPTAGSESKGIVESITSLMQLLLSSAASCVNGNDCDCGVHFSL